MGQYSSKEQTTEEKIQTIENRMQKIIKECKGLYATRLRLDNEIEKMEKDVGYHSRAKKDAIEKENEKNKKEVDALGKEAIDLMAELEKFYKEVHDSLETSQTRIKLAREKLFVGKYYDVPIERKIKGELEDANGRKIENFF
jgi:hypothetical protein